MSSYSAARVQVTAAMPGKVLCKPCSPTPGCRGPPRRGPTTRRSMRSPTPGWTPPRPPRRGGSPPAGHAPGHASAWPCRPARRTRSRCTRAWPRPPGGASGTARPAARRVAAVAAPRALRLPAAERARGGQGCTTVVDDPLDPGDGDEHAVLPGAHDLGAPALVVFTSGTAGAARPVTLTYANWLWSALGSAVALGCPRDERWLCALPLTHVGGLSILLRSVIAQTTAIVHERFETERVLAELRRPDGPTVVSLVPTTLARLLDGGLRRPPALRWALLGGAAIPAALLERARDAAVPVAPTYGLTEACSQVAPDRAPPFFTGVGLADHRE